MTTFRQTRMTFRRADEGGDVLDRPKVCPGNALTGQRYLVLLIHGFNNNKGEAQKAYKGFKNLQRKIGGLNFDQAITGGLLVEFYWPGDVGYFPAKNYEDSLERAIKIAHQLPGALRRAVGHNDPIEIDIVAHSMGCRLALEMVRKLTVVRDVFVRRIACMAAAVPIFLLEPPERLRAGLDHSSVEKVMSLFSRDDGVLYYGFAFGQLDAQGESWTEGDEWREGATIALGYECWISANPSSILGKEAQKKINGAGHSDYWGWEKKTRNKQGRQANSFVKDFLGFTSVGLREVLPREKDSRETVMARTPGLDREIISRNADGSEGDQCIEV